MPAKGKMPAGLAKYWAGKKRGGMKKKTTKKRTMKRK
jgi:hypothetical protein